MNHSTDPNHIHAYDAQGKITCCSLEEKIDRRSDPPILRKTKLSDHSGHNHGDHDDHSGDDHGDVDEHDHENLGIWPAVISGILLLSGLVLDHVIDFGFFTGWVRVVWYAAAYIPVAYAVIREAVEALAKGEIFTEFFLMSIATIGAFAIGEYPEGAAVMLFYAVGELFQIAAVTKAKNNIRSLLDVRPRIAHVYRGETYSDILPEEVNIGETIQVKVGEKIPLDGLLISNNASLNTAAITGESKPKTVRMGEKVLAGSINLNAVIEVTVEKNYKDSSISKILELVQNATSKKAKTELLIRRLAKIYTPIVVYTAIAVLVIPYFIVDDYMFSDWLYRALIFLVISCPCALVISIPLGYFGGLGAASRHGILFKGATFLDQITKINTLVMDKTGTVTKGVFKINDIHTEYGVDEKEMMDMLIALESNSTHPIAKAITGYGLTTKYASEVKEIAGKGLMGMVDGKQLIAGNKSLMDQLNIIVDTSLNQIVESIVLVAVDNKFVGYVTIADELKHDAKHFVFALPKYGIKELVMLSGDKNSITQKVAEELGIEVALGSLMPENKLTEVEELKKDPNKKIAFVGDGINDAPVLAASDIGIAMGAMGSDVAIEAADIIIQNDEPSKILTAIKIGKDTQSIIWQNIWMAMTVKIIVLILGAIGLATMWEAVFADVGVALLAILNAIRIQRKEY